MLGLLLVTSGWAQVTLSPATKTVGPAAVSYELLVDTGSEWNASTDASWVAVTPNPGRGQVIATVSVEANATNVSRSAVVTIAGASHALNQAAAGADGCELFGVGSNSVGQLGAANVPLSRPGSSPNYPGVTAAKAGYVHSCFIKSDGSLWTMGSNSYGQLGDGTMTSRSTPVQVATNVAAIASGQYHTVFLKTDGTLWAMGDNTYGQLGDKSNFTRLTPVQIATGVASVSAGAYHTVFVKTDGSLWAVGLNSDGQLGNGTNTNLNTPAQVATSVSSASAGAAHTLFVKSDGSLWATGANSSGQLGNGTTTKRSSAAQVATGVVTASAGNSHSLYVKTDGSLWATGSNSFGQLGDGSTTTRTSAVQITTGVTTASAGDTHSFFIKSDGTLWGMGSNSLRELGDGTTTGRSAPVAISTAVISVSAGSNSTFFIKSDSSLWSMGSNSSGRLGLLVDVRASSIPIATAVTAVSGGTFHALFIDANRVLWAVGANSSGQLGDGTTTSRSAPVQIASNVVSADAGYQHSVFVKTDGTLWAMGSNTYGQLGDGSTTSKSTPVQVATGVVAASAGFGHTLFIKADGSLWAVGYNLSGQLGTGTTTNRSTPIQIATGVASASAGSSHSLFVKTDGSLWGAGSNSSGNLGNGSTTDRSSPIQISTGVSNASAGVTHSVFVKTDGSLWAMGDNSNGQLGDGSQTMRTTPVQIAAGVAVAFAGSTHSVFVKTNSSLWTTGANSSGQLGDGSLIRRTLPVQIAIGVSSASAGEGDTYFLLRADGRTTPPFQITPSITWPNPAAVTYGTPLSSNQLNAISSASGSFTYSPAAGTVLNAGTHTLSASFSPTDAESFTTAFATRQFTVQPAPATVTLSDLERTYSGVMQTPTVTTVPDNLAISLTYNGSLTPATNAGSYAVVATITDSNYTGSAAGTLTIAKAVPLVTWNDPDSITYGTALSGAQLNATTAVAGTLTYLPDAGTILDAGTRMLTVSFTPDDKANYVGLAIQRALTVNKAPATLTLGSLSSTYDGSAHSVSIVTSPANLMVVVTYDGSPTPPTTAGSHTVSAIIDEANYVGSTTGMLVIDRAPQLIDFASLADRPFSPASIPLSATASSGLPVAFTVVRGPAGLADQSLVPSGAGTVTVRASQAGNTNFLPAPEVERTFTLWTTFAAWQLQYFSEAERADASLSGPNADPDADGLSNLVEYAMGLDPRRASVANTRIEIVEGRMTFIHQRPSDRNDLTYQVEVSQDLNNWVTIGLISLMDSDDGSTQIWKTRRATEDSRPVFYRLVIVH